MKHMKTVTKTTEHTYVEAVTCDLCREKYSTDWNAERFDTIETKVKHNSGVNYPDGGSGVEVSFDICPDCFDTKLVPALREMGAEPTVREWDW